MISYLDWVENIVGKGENAGYQHFLLLPQCFQKPILQGSLKLGIVSSKQLTIYNMQSLFSLSLKIYRIENILRKRRKLW